MPGAVMHALFPLLPILAFTRFPKRLVFALWPIVFLIDLDYVIPPHRAVFHNVFWVVALLALWALAPRSPRLARHQDAFLVAALFWGGHEAMDVFYGGIVPFWPLLDTTWLVEFSVDVATGTNRPLFYFDVGTQPGPPTTARVYPFFTPLDAAVLVATGAAAGVGWLLRRRTDTPPSEP